MQMIRSTASNGPDGAYMQRQVMIAIGGGLASAVLSLSLLTGSGLATFAANLSPLPLFLTGFSSGARGVMIAALTAFVALAFAGGLPLAAVHLGTVGVPAWIIAYHALSHRILSSGQSGWFSVGEIISRMSALGAAFVCAITIAASGGDNGIEASVRNFLQSSFAGFFPPEAGERGNDLVDSLVPAFPGIATMTWMMMLLLNAVAAQALLVRAKQALRGSPRYRAIVLPEWVFWAFVAVAALKLVSTGDMEYLAQNLVVIMAAPFFFVGLAVAHTLAGRISAPVIPLAMLYSFVLISPAVAGAVVVLGFAEHWLGLRERYGPLAKSAKPRNQSEDE